MDMTLGTSSPAGSTSNKRTVRIVKVEFIDADGKSSYDPPKFEYWVVDTNSPPNVLAIFSTLQEAQKHVVKNGYHLVP